MEGYEGYSFNNIKTDASQLKVKEDYDEKTIKKWFTHFIKRFFNNQFKRSCCPDGPKITQVSLSPRGDFRMPSDTSGNSYLRELENL